MWLYRAGRVHRIPREDVCSWPEADLHDAENETGKTPQSGDCNELGHGDYSTFTAP